MVFSPEGAILAETENQKVMKKNLEVLQYGETDIRFNTDVDPAKDPEVVTEVIAEAASSRRAEKSSYPAPEQSLVPPKTDPRG